MYRLLHVHSIVGETTNSSSEMFILHPPVVKEALGAWARSVGGGFFTTMDTAALLYGRLNPTEMAFCIPESYYPSPLFRYLELRLHTFKDADNYDYLKEALDEMPGQTKWKGTYSWKVDAKLTIELIKWVLMYEEALDILLAGTVMVSLRDNEPNYLDKFDMLDAFGVHWRD